MRAFIDLAVSRLTGNIVFVLTAKELAAAEAKGRKAYVAGYGLQHLLLAPFALQSGTACIEIAGFSTYLIAELPQHDAAPGGNSDLKRRSMFKAASYAVVEH